MDVTEEQHIDAVRTSDPAVPVPRPNSVSSASPRSSIVSPIFSTAVISTAAS
ncbi:hypothetical protein [Rhodococcus wratislaviensis]|uniref:hypothetical protein n=1 Tax=Rhodococcus wratislaviensis TaxID=44752 RepID=UPI001359FFBA|nr:hypothetical protein [Rhodococcus wratislaviensis]